MKKLKIKFGDNPPQDAGEIATTAEPAQIHELIQQTIHPDKLKEAGIILTNKLLCISQWTEDEQV